MKHIAKSTKAFTLIELLVVIVIIGILWTVWMLTYSGYSLTARDANRFSTMEKLRDGLLYVASQKQLPLPTSSKNIKVNTNIIWYQWYAGQAVLDEIVDFKSAGKDPKDQTFYTYYVTKDRTGFQLLWYLEENANIEASIFPQAYAVNYSGRFPHVEGKNLWILTDASLNPIQDVVAWADLDIGTTGTTYIAHVSDILKLSGNNTVLRTAARNYTCRRIQAAGMWGGSWYYKINPGAAASELNTYCDMTNDGGGWTRLARLINNGAIQENILWNSIPFTSLKAVKVTDPTDSKIATFSTSQVANTNTTWITSIEWYKIMLWWAGAYGIYNSWQNACSWASTLWMRWAWYTVAWCGTYPTLTAAWKSTISTTYLSEFFDVDIYIKN